MFNLEEAYSNVSLKDIEANTTEFQLWKHYCSNFQDINKPFTSELYDDNNPSCRVFVSNGRLKYKDFGTGDLYGIYDYIQTKYNCNFREALVIIANDFKIKESKVISDSPKVQLLNHIEPKQKAYIEILPQGFTITDYNYWSQYYITLELLEEYNVYSAKTVWLVKPDKTVVLEYTRNNPIYAYKFINDNGYSYKIYFPLSKDKKFKWLFSGGSSKDIEGYDQLNLHGNILILTKSLKDCMCYRVLGYDAISLQGETNKLDGDLVRKLLKRFDKIVVNYDNDEEGIKNTKKLERLYNFESFYIDEYKDLSDYIKHKGLDMANELITNKIQQLG